MSKKERYFMEVFDDQYYIFDSKKISREEVDEQIEYDYYIVSKAMTEKEILDTLNRK